MRKLFAKDYSGLVRMCVGVGVDVVCVGGVCGMWQNQRPRLPRLARQTVANDKCTFCIPNATRSLQQVAACNWQPTSCNLQLPTGNWELGTCNRQLTTL